MTKQFSSLLELFPKPIRFAFAYGSGAFPQKGYSEAAVKKSMLDLVFAVNDPISWHESNIKMNPSHYARFPKLLPSIMPMIQEAGAGIFYNTLVKLDDKTIKYGVISTSRLINDLNYWDTLYVSGRLHKPVHLIKSDSYFDSLIQQNLHNAIRCSLLLLPNRFSEPELFKCISSLSYLGDFRMGLAENPNKVKNLVEGNLSGFQQLYKNIIIKENLKLEDAGYYRSDIDNNNRKLALLTSLPHSLKHRIADSYGGSVWSDDYSSLFELFERLSVENDYQKHIERAIQSIVRESSFIQTTKGIISAGFLKSLQYGLSKMAKKFQAR